jgi:hypothetical protein
MQEAQKTKTYLLVLLILFRNTDQKKLLLCVCAFMVILKIFFLAAMKWELYCELKILTDTETHFIILSCWLIDFISCQFGEYYRSFSILWCLSPLAEGKFSINQAWLYIRANGNHLVKKNCHTAMLTHCLVLRLTEKKPSIERQTDSCNSPNFDMKKLCTFCFLDSRRTEEFPGSCCWPYTPYWERSSGTKSVLRIRVRMFWAFRIR